MDRIAVAGISIHGTDVSGLEGVRRPTPERAGTFARDLADVLGASELVFLATCNRVEVVFAREEGEPPDDGDLQRLCAHLAETGSESALREAFVLRRGPEAARHVFRVAASLDSLVLGEDQILAQVRQAYGQAADAGLVGPLLGPLFHHALAVGKQVRSETDLARHPVSVVNLAVAALERRSAGGELAVAVVGAGEMGGLLARTLAAAGVPPRVVVNRSIEAARRVAADCGCAHLGLEAFRAGEHPVDAVVAATSAKGLVLDEPTLRRLAAVTPSGRPLFGVDLAVPRDLAAVDGLEILDLDALRDIAESNRALRAEAAALAEVLVERKVDTFARRFGEQAAAPVVGELREAASQLVDRELAALLAGRLAHLTEEDRRALERWVRTTLGRVLHLPIAAIKRLVADMGGGGAEDETPVPWQSGHGSSARPAGRDAAGTETLS